MGGLMQNASIQRKLTAIIVCTSLAGLSLACVIFDLFERSSFRSEMTRQFTALADTLGGNTSAALAFDDRKSATDLLGALRADEHTVGARLYDENGKVFAEYRRAGVDPGFELPGWQAGREGAAFTGNSLVLFRSVFVSTEKVGTIEILADLDALHARIRQYTEISITVMLISVLATYLVSSRLLRLITEPILHLSKVATQVTHDEDYTLRAIPQGGDEVGTLIHSFNHMLERVEQRDEALKHANDDLEERVQTRTRELHQEVSERKLAQKLQSIAYEATRVLAEANPVELTLPKVMELLCEGLDCEIGVVWQLDTAGEALECVEAWQRPGPALDEFIAVTRKMKLSPGVGLPGLVWTSRQPALLKDLAQDQSFLRMAAANSCHLTSGVAFPILHDEQFSGVIEIFTREGINTDSHVLELAEALGSQLGQYMSRKQAEESLKASLKASEDLQFAMDQHCIVAKTDPRGVIGYVNDNFCSISKYERQELLGKNHSIVNSKYHTQEFIRDLWETISGGRVWKGEIRNRAKDGKYYWVDTTIVPFCDGSGKPFQFIAIRTDITGLKNIQQDLYKAKQAAEAASQAKSDFLANMSHEIRTPLNGVIGMTDLALETQLTPEQREYLETVKASSDSLLTVINDILDFSKIEAGKMDMEAVEFDLRDLLESTLKTLALRADEKGLELLCDIASEVPKAVSGDSGRLRQIVLNLVGNAIKFTEKGEVALKVQAESREGEEIVFHFTVADTGIGIAEGKRELIFDPFAQADTSTTRKYGGTGLGLTISARLVGMMHGKIWVESELGKGSQFHFTARLGVGTGKEIKVEPLAPAKLLRDVRVLVVDDNATNRRVLEGMLRQWQMKPTCAESGKVALDQLSQACAAAEPFHLIVTDMNMPEMSGLQFAEEVRKRPELAAATIMMLTSAGGRGDAVRLRALGIAAYLLKPIRQSELREAIGRVLSGRAQSGAVSPQIDERSAQDARERQQSLRVLLAEDNAVNQRLAVRLLEKRGHRVSVAGTGAEALKSLDQETFDLVLMDVQMPEMDGMEATAVIRRKEKISGSRQAIVALTAHAMKGDREKCLAAGMDGYLTKPIRPQELDQLLEKYVNAKREREHVTPKP